MQDLTKEEISKEIIEAEKVMDELGDRVRRLWDRICIHPEQWEQNQYPDAGKFWVIAILGYRCLYLNPFEGGWGWGRFKKYGNISEHHWDDAEIQHKIYQVMYAIDYGGSG